MSLHPDIEDMFKHALGLTRGGLQSAAALVQANVEYLNGKTQELEKALREAGDRVTEAQKLASDQSVEVSRLRGRIRALRDAVQKSEGPSHPWPIRREEILKFCDSILDPK